MAPRHYTGIDGLIESVPASLEERKKLERKGLKKNLKKKWAEARRCRCTAKNGFVKLDLNLADEETGLDFVPGEATGPEQQLSLQP